MIIWQAAYTSWMAGCQPVCPFIYMSIQPTVCMSVLSSILLFYNVYTMSTILTLLLGCFLMKMTTTMTMTTIIPPHVNHDWDDGREFSIDEELTSLSSNNSRSAKVKYPFNVVTEHRCQVDTSGAINRKDWYIVSRKPLTTLSTQITIGIIW